MTVATDIISRLTKRLGKARRNIATAIPPIHLGGGADVVVFPDAPQGCVYVSAGLVPLQSRELALVTPEPHDWCVPFLSRLAAAAAATRRLDLQSTTPLGDGPLEAIALTSLDGVATIEDYKPLHLVIGVTRDELQVCRTHGTPFVVAALRRAGIYPFSMRGRGSVVEPAHVGASLLDDPRLSERGRAAFATIVHGLVHEVDAMRGQYAASDIPVLCSMYEHLPTWEQQSDLVLLVADRITPEIVALCRSFVRDVVAMHEREPLAKNASDLYQLATALAVLDGRVADYHKWQKMGAEAVIAAARERLLSA